MMEQPTPMTTTLSVVLVTETWPPEINGVAHSVFQLAKGLKQLGHRVMLICPAQTTSLACCGADQVVLVQGFKIPKYPQLQAGMPAYRTVKQALAQFEADVVHIVTEGPLGLSALYAAKQLNLPISSGFHSPFHEFSRFFGLGFLLTPILAYLRFFHRRTHVTCVPSPKTKQQLQALGFERLSVVGRGVDVAHFHPSKRCESRRASWGVSPQATVLLSVGRLSPEKDLDLVIEASRALRMAQPMREIQLVIVGDGPERARLEAMAPECVFLGMQTGEDLAACYASADVFCFASQVETFGNVVLEAMASGLPVLAFDDACAGMMIEQGQQGWLALLGHATQFVDDAEHLPQKSRLHQMGQAARHRVAHMSW